ncbi:hypothetical protein SCLCIDRAFT_1217972 [Scleroderma citrinum Foug A]|uniref:Uncharacterized protein n=1 Tax=Scleroderma citrinum Foug A TaxID=1036808 RepID=A0A0C2ZBI6_9AGAM|nr:hypothetical protein SCLCIDRAFT_1217972 [Scleroderma citrinum Foug A]
MDYMTAPFQTRITTFPTVACGLVGHLRNLGIYIPGPYTYDQLDIKSSHFNATNRTLRSLLWTPYARLPVSC